MKKTTITAILLAASLFAANAETQIQKPGVRSKSTFAVFVDAKTYEAIPDKLEAYKKAVENDGLGTYLISDDWQNPEQVKEQIAALSKGKAPLEGVVFIGDIPVAMIRDAQHLTSAFKMDQNYPWQDSSIPSDRFYDDFDLKFDFLKQDEEVKSYFYYTLRADSEQHISSDIYSARIRAVGEGAPEKIAAFLDRAIAAHAEANALDNMFMFRGHGYNSDGFSAWSGEQLRLREQLPTVFKNGSKFRAGEYRCEFPTKNYIFEQLRDPEMDVALLHHHGSDDREYINGSELTADMGKSVENIKAYLRSKMERSRDPQQTKKDLKARLDVPDSWFATSPELHEADSVKDRALDIYLDDIYAAKPNSRFVMFDACYNGSFHLDDCIANAYIFSDGKTLITQGNSVNSLQDRTPDRYIGLFACGARIGNWGRFQQTTLETHMIGDPTYRFSNTAGFKGDINKAIAAPAGKWKKYLRSDIADVQALALRRLNDTGYKGIEKLLTGSYYNSDLDAVRLEALVLMGGKGGKEFTKMLCTAVQDNCELVRRLAISDACINCDPSLVEPLTEVMIMDKFSKRASYKACSGISLFENSEENIASINKVFDACKDVIMTGTRVDTAYVFDNLRFGEERAKDYLEDARDTTAKPRRRLNSVTYFRNYPSVSVLPLLEELIEDKDFDEKLRVAAMEAIGWYRLSFKADELPAFCDKIIGTQDAPEALKNEALKTKNRLKKY